jgi:uncharacterized protein (DUF1778 family)
MPENRADQIERAPIIILAVQTNTSRGEYFKLTHRQTNRLVMRLDNPFVIADQRRD